MTNEEKKRSLADKVAELAIADGYKTKQETQKRRKCSQCKKGYLGQEGSDTCGPACRKRKSRS